MNQPVTPVGKSVLPRLAIALLGLAFPFLATDAPGQSPQALDSLRTQSRPDPVSPPQTTPAPLTLAQATPSPTPPPPAAPAGTPATGLPMQNVLYRPELAADDYASEKCRLDLAIPSGKPGFATVVWFHAGGLTGGDRAIPDSLRNQGYAVVAAGYRLSPRVKAPTYIEDAGAAVAWTLKNIANYGGDPTKVFVSGHSAGGYLTLMVGLDKRWLAPHGLDPDRLAGLAPLSPQVITHFTVRAERGLKDTQVVVDDLAPLAHVRPDCPPVLLVTGDRDTELLGRYEENAYLWRVFKLVQHPRVELHEVQGFDHGQMVEPGIKLLLRFMDAELKRRS